MEISEYNFEVTKTLSNIKKHDFTISDYKLSKSEADIVEKALTQNLADIVFMQKMLS